MSGFVYAVKDKQTNKYKGFGSNKWVDDVAEARIYPRICDAKSSVWGGSKAFDSRYELVKCEVTPITLQSYYRVDTKHVIKPILEDGTLFESKVFDNLSAAEEYLVQATKRCNLHRDYFTLFSISKEEFEKALPNVRERPSWDDYFLGLALVISKRSHDIHTQHGCVIVDRLTHHILGTGYNGFPRGMEDSKLPTTRPEKYDWMVHSEVNACNNMTMLPDSNTVAYVTGECCTPCLMHMWQRGIGRVIQRAALGSKFLIDEKTRKNKEILLAQTGMKVYDIHPDLSWLRGIEPGVSNPLST